MRLQLLLAGALLFATGLSAQAHELDKEITVSAEQAQLARALPKTVVVRTQIATGEAQVLELANQPAMNKQTIGRVHNSDFTALTQDGKKASELDRDSSSSSWYFYCPPSYGYYAPTYYYYSYSYSYSMYWTYNWGGWRYQYYSWPYF